MYILKHIYTHTHVRNYSMYVQLFSNRDIIFHTRHIITLFPLLPPASGHINSPTVTVSTVRATSAHISWTNHTHQGAKSYLIQFTRVNGAGQLGGCPSGQHNGTITVNSSQLSVALEGLEEASTYMVTCQALSEAMGNSAPSSPVYFTTLGAGEALGTIT